MRAINSSSSGVKPPFCCRRSASRAISSSLSIACKEHHLYAWFCVDAKLMRQQEGRCVIAAHLLGSVQSEQIINTAKPEEPQEKQQGPKTCCLCERSSDRRIQEMRIRATMQACAGWMKMNSSRHRQTSRRRPTIRLFFSVRAITCGCTAFDRHS